MTTKAERKAAAQAEVESLLPDVDVMSRPSAYQYGLTKDWVAWEDGCDPDGWFNATCPLQTDRRRRPHPARINFSKGVLQCGASDNGLASCHPGRNFMSIVNAVTSHG